MIPSPLSGPYISSNNILPNGTEGTAPQPAKKNTGYLPSLDGWRAFAVIGVMMTHDRPWNLFGHSSAIYKGYGGYGVYLFFAISGFLITTRILEETKLIGRFNIRRFYIRRVLRIQPASLVYLTVIAVLITAKICIDSWNTWFAALLLYLNFTYRTYKIGGLLTGHFWTLAVEEHFYILLSLTLLLVKKHQATALAFLYIAFFALSTYGQDFGKGWLDPNFAPRSTYWQLTPLLLAALVAALMQKNPLKRAVQAVLRPWVMLIATPLLMEGHSLFNQLINHTHLRFERHLRSELPFLALYLSIFWIISTVFHPHSWTTRMFETAPLRFVGKISYSLYLWHVLVYDLWHQLLFSGSGLFAHLSTGHFPYSLLERPARVAASFAMATLSFYFVEKPMMRLGHKLAPPATPGRKDMSDLPVEQPISVATYMDELNAGPR